MTTMRGPAVQRVDGLADLPIDVAEAIYSPDFVELSSVTANGTPLALPMSFTLDVPANRVRFSSPVTAARLAHYTRDPRCCVSFTRVTAGYPFVLLQGTVELGEVAEGNQRGPARRFTVAPLRLTVLGDAPATWDIGPPAETPAAGGGAATTPSAPAGALPRPSTEIAAADLDLLCSLPTVVVGLIGADGLPLTLPVEPRHADGLIEAALPNLAGTGLTPLAGRASIAGHTWTKQGPRYLACTGRATLAGSRLTFAPARLLRRNI
jgi:hypothetical protein